MNYPSADKGGIIGIFSNSPQSGWELTPKLINDRNLKFFNEWVEETKECDKKRWFLERFF
jgi:hypothetical protein